MVLEATGRSALTDGMLVPWWLVNCALIYLSCGSAPAKAGSQQTLYRVWTDYGVEHIGSLTLCTSVAACAVRTRQMYPQSTSFMFNPFLGMCLPGGRLSKVFPSTSDAEGHLYVELKAPPNLAVVSQGEATACVGIFDEPLTYDQAAQKCQDMGYFLVSVKDLPKLNILTQLAGDRSLWVGCGDAAKEGTFVWKEDGSELSDATLVAVFSDTQPNNFLKNCCVYTNDTHKLDVYDCSVQFPFVCEVSLDNCQPDILT